jgi:hypothetical protein
MPFKLDIEVLRASQLPDTATFVNTQDPYVKVSCGDADPVSTTPVSEGGTDVAWTKEHGNVITMGTIIGADLVIEVWNANTFQDELIGQSHKLCSDSLQVPIVITSTGSLTLKVDGSGSGYSCNDRTLNFGQTEVALDLQVRGRTRQCLRELWSHNNS